MSSMAKTIAFWAALVLTAVLLYNVFSRPSIGREKEISFTKLLEEVNSRNVKSATIIRIACVFIT